MLGAAASAPSFPGVATEVSKNCPVRQHAASFDHILSSTHLGHLELPHDPLVVVFPTLHRLLQLEQLATSVVVNLVRVRVHVAERLDPLLKLSLLGKDLLAHSANHFKLARLVLQKLLEVCAERTSIEVRGQELGRRGALKLRRNRVGRWRRRKLVHQVGARPRLAQPHPRDGGGLKWVVHGPVPEGEVEEKRRRRRCVYRLCDSKSGVMA